MSAEYRNDFILLQDKFGRLFHIISKAVKSWVPVDDLKEYLCENFDDFKFSLQEASTTDDVMKAVRNQLQIGIAQMIVFLTFSMFTSVPPEQSV